MSNDYENNAFDDVGDSVQDATHFAIDMAREIHRANHDSSALEEATQGTNPSDNPPESPNTEQSQSEPNASDNNSPTEQISNETNTQDAQKFSTKAEQSAGSDTSASSFASDVSKQNVEAKVQEETAKTSAQNASVNATANTTSAAGTSTGTGATATASANASATATATGAEAGASAGAAAGAGAAGATAEATATASASATAGGGAAAGGSAGGTLAAGSSGGVIGLIVAAVILVAGAGARKAGKDYTEITGDDTKGGNMGIFLVFALLFIVVILVATLVAPIFLLYNYVTAPIRAIENAINTVTTYIEQEQKEDFFQDLLGLTEVGDVINKQQELNEESVEIYKKIIDYAIYKSYKEYCWDLFLDIPTQFELAKSGYSPAATYYKFLEAPYPYALRYSNGEYITVNYYLKHHDEVWNSDLNYAEFLAVLAQSPNFTLDSFTYSDFYDLLICDKTISHLFELKVVDTAYSSAESTATIDTISQIDDDALDKMEEAELEEVDEPNWLEMTVEAIKQWWARVTWHFNVELYPMGLQEMYEIAGTLPFDYNSKVYTQTNYELLDQTEIWLRELVPGVYLGTSCKEQRSSRSNVYAYLYSAQLVAFGNVSLPTGRSAVSYTNESYVFNVVEGLSYAQAYCTKRLHVVSRTVPEGSSVILDMYGLIDQTQQEGYRGTWDGTGEDTRTTIARQGCIDCSYVMVYEYFYRRDLNLQYVSANYVNSNAQFVWSRFRDDYNLPGIYDNISYSKERIKQYLGNGTPVIFFIDGHWEYGGRIFHNSSNTHFIVIMGYDDNGFYVYDPGGNEGQKNTTTGPIPYNAFYAISNKSFKSFDVPDGCDVYYLVNTLSEGINE